MKVHRVVFWKLAAIREAVGGIVRVEDGHASSDLLALLRGDRISFYDDLAYRRDVPAIEKFDYDDDRDANPSALQDVRTKTLAHIERILKKHQADGWRVIRKEQGDDYYGWGLAVLERTAPKS